MKKARLNPQHACACAEDRSPAHTKRRHSMLHSHSCRWRTYDCERNSRLLTSDCSIVTGARMRGQGHVSVGLETSLGPRVVTRHGRHAHHSGHSRVGTQSANRNNYYFDEHQSQRVLRQPERASEDGEYEMSGLVSEEYDSDNESDES